MSDGQSHFQDTYGISHEAWKFHNLCSHCSQPDNTECIECAQQRHELKQEAEDEQDRATRSP